jgi:uncharacterized Zn finger protein (UPF0148 family)
MPCKGICIRHKAISNYYANGQKRCKICGLFIKWDGLFCPCCGHRLRARPRNPKLNAKLREKRAIEEAKKVEVLYHSYNLSRNV